MTLAEKLAKMLLKSKKTLSIAESCTGGLLSAMLTEISGSSKFLKLGVVSYSNDAKMKLLHVKESDIKKYGAVSECVAMQMSQNIRKILKTDFGIGITGIAGPTGGTKKKPVGLVFISIATKNDCLCLKCNFENSQRAGTVPNRKSIRSKTVNLTLKTMLEFL